MAEIVWEDPPQREERIGNHQRIADELRAHPNRWARIATEVSHGYITSIRRGTIEAYRPVSDFETVNRNERKVDGRRRVDVYARYVPQSDKED